MSEPSAYRIQNALTGWHEARQALLESDEALEGDEALLTELLGRAEGDVDDILARVLRAGVHAANMAEAADEQAKLIVARKRRYQLREDRLRALALALMETLGRKRLELADMTASIVKGREGVHIPNADLVPDRYCEILMVKKPDRTIIKADLEAGLPVEGAELRVGADYLTIRKG